MKTILMFILCFHLMCGILFFIISFEELKMSYLNEKIYNVNKELKKLVKK